MNKNWKRLLSLLLALVMTLSLGVTSFAEGSEAEEPAQEPEGEALELIPIDPARLNVRKLGQQEKAEEDPFSGLELSPVEAGDPNEVFRVSIFLDEPSALDAGYSVQSAGLNAAGRNYRAALRTQQDRLTAQIESAIGHKLDVRWNLTLSVNAISANVTLSDLIKIRDLPGIRAIQRENVYYPVDGETADPNTANTSESMVGAAAAWNLGYTGAGSRIAIIDTGIDDGHQSFAETPFLNSIREADAENELMTAAQISALAGELNSGTGNYLSAKIPYAYNYADKKTSPTDHTHDKASEHGSHVAGIAAANRYIGDETDAASAVHAVGMAPDAQLFVMKVFSAGGASDSDYMAAIEDAMILGCDVANLSLGSSVQGWTYDNFYGEKLQSWTDGGPQGKMVLSISAGNAYDAPYLTDAGSLYLDDISMHTGGSPGTFVNSLCVAAAENIGSTGAPILVGGAEVYYDDAGETPASFVSLANSTAYSYVYIDAVGKPEDYAAVNAAESLSGKIVIVNRGEINFSAKAENAKSYSPKGMLIANNRLGSMGITVQGFTGSFPVAGIVLDCAKVLKEKGTAHTASGITYYTGTMTVTGTVSHGLTTTRENAILTEFSSWGVPGSMIMKPEITAPGGSIYSVFGRNQNNSGAIVGGTDQYELMSGTSMAAPHIAGLTAVLAERIREEDLLSLNTALSRGYNVRAVTQSLMMSTATPMMPDGYYLPILQQGSGLVDVKKAVNAKSVVMMGAKDSTLTARTGSAADGKVKVELGDDPARKGEYAFSFTVYNLTDEDLHFNVATDLFTQAIDGEFMSRGTAWLDGAYTAGNWNRSIRWAPIDVDGPAEEHDVDGDGDTDRDDAQAILDHVTGLKELNMDWEDLVAVADLDGDEMITSQDAYLLLGLLPHGYEDGVVPAHGSRQCFVAINLSGAIKAELDAYPVGAYIEGFTYVFCDTETSEGIVCDDVHSIPILGFYGSWTEASMFDTTSYVQNLYEQKAFDEGYTELEPQLPYSGNADTNYLTLQKDGVTFKFSGNPYMVEDLFPEDHLAINSGTKLTKITYTLLRAAGTTGFAAIGLDGEEPQVLTSRVIGSEVSGLYFDNTGAIQNNSPKTWSPNWTPADSGLSDSDRVRVGFYAIPEYYGMLWNDSYIDGDSGMLSASGFSELLASGELGRGAFVGYDFIVDDVAPVIGTVSLNGSELTLSASDNHSLAYVAVMSLDGADIYYECAPGLTDFSDTVDISSAIANANGYVAVFAGDYAGNEAAVALSVNGNTHVEKTVFVRTDTVEAGKEYLVVSTMTPGTGYALYYTPPTSGTTATTEVQTVSVYAGDSGTAGQPYIEIENLPSTGIWTAGTGSTSGTWTFVNNGWYLRRSNSNNLTITKDTSRRDWTWDGANNRLSINSRYLRYAGNTFSLGTDLASVYLFQKLDLNYEVDPYAVSEVQVTPDSLELYKGNTYSLSAKVLPLTAGDRSVTWSSSDPSVATVDETGLVTAVGGGNAEITVTSRADPSKFAICPVKVVSINKELSAIVWDEQGGVYFSRFHADSLPVWTKLHDDAKALPLTSAFINSVSSNLTLYASTLDTGSQTSVLYTVDRSSYALTEFGNNYVMAFGTARAPSGSTDSFVYGFATYLLFGNLTPKQDSEAGGTFSGLPSAYMDFSKTTGDDTWIAAVCAKAVSSRSATYYFLDETGKIWLTTLNVSIFGSVSFSDPVLVVDTGISTNILYQSLYYDGTYLYWTHTDGDACELIIYVPSTEKLYRAGDFGDSVWPVAGVYTDGQAAPASAGDEPMEGPFEPAEQELAITCDELMTESVKARLIYEFSLYGIDLSFPIPELEGEDGEDEPIGEAEPIDETEPAGEAEPIEEAEPIDEPVPIEEPAPVAEPTPVGGETQAFRGSLMAFRDVRMAAAPGRIASLASVKLPIRTEGEDSFTLQITETEDSHNGMIAVDYDPAILRCTAVEANDDITLTSVNLDEDESGEKAIITIAYANKNADGEDDLPVGTVIATLTFARGCEDGEVTPTTLERNDELELNEYPEEPTVVPGLGHNWDVENPVWTWAEDFSGATCKLSCTRCGAEISAEAQVTSETVEPSYTAPGSITYTAVAAFEELPDRTFTDTHVEEIPQLTGVVITLDPTDRATVDPDSLTIPVGGTVYDLLPTPVHEDPDYRFDGWFLPNDVQVTAETTFNADAVLTAYWHLPGDVNGDGKVSTKDFVTLMKLLAGEDLYCVWGARDVNGDGKVSTKDFVTLMKYLAGEDIAIY